MVVTGVQVLGAKVIYSHPPSGYGRGRRWHAARAVPDFSRGRRPRAKRFLAGRYGEWTLFLRDPRFSQVGGVGSGPNSRTEQNIFSQGDRVRCAVGFARTHENHFCSPTKESFLGSALCSGVVAVQNLHTAKARSSHSRAVPKGAAAPDVFEPA